MFRRRQSRSRGPQHLLESDLAAQADGTLEPAVADRVMRRVEEDPALRRELAAQESVAAALRGAGVVAPADLRRRVHAMALHSSSGGFPGRGWSVRAGAMFGLAGALGALSVMLALMLGATGTPTIVQAAAVGLRPPTGMAPPSGGASRHLAVGLGGLAFPDWSPGWRAAGVRTDHVGARLARTVLYVDSRGRQVGYVIVAGSPLPISPAKALTVASVRYSTEVRSGTVTVSWREGGHTCVLVSRSVGAGALIQLASVPRALPSYAG